MKRGPIDFPVATDSSLPPSRAALQRSADPRKSSSGSSPFPFVGVFLFAETSGLTSRGITGDLVGSVDGVDITHDRWDSQVRALSDTGTAATRQALR